MPSLQDNLSYWNEYYDWPQQGDEWSAGWGNTEMLWQGTIMPRISAYLPASTILEIAPGFGRWTRYLKDYCEQLFLVDLSEKCVQACRARFAGDRHIKCYLNDGKSLDMIPDHSVDFAFSFDSLVHAEADVMEAYVYQLAKKLKPSGVAFLHHANLGAYAHLLSRNNWVPPRLRMRLVPFLVRKGLLVNQFSGRAASMSAAKLEQYCRDAKIQCISQELINWHIGRHQIDSFSIIGHVEPPVRNRIFRNPGFLEEQKRLCLLSEQYPLKEKIVVATALHAGRG